MRKFLVYWLPVVVWMGVIFIFSSRQKVSVSDEYTINFLFFKTLHVLEYSFLMMLALRSAQNTIGKSYSYLAFVICILYAISDEVHQRFVPTREGRLRDVIIDSGGMLLSWILIVQLLPKAPKKLKNLAKYFQLFS